MTEERQEIRFHSRCRGNVLIQALVIVVVGLLFGLLANAISPRGLELRKNYFPNTPVQSVVTQPTNSTTPIAHVQNSNSTSTDAVLARLASKGLKPVTLDEMTQLLEDPRRMTDQVIFVDARNDEHYREGHIAGAYQLDHYYAQNYLPTVLPVCQNAERIVVYCTGGDCEDSESTAILLGQIGVPMEKIFVFAGGIKEWTAAGLLLESGSRKSGTMVRPAK